MSAAKVRSPTSLAAEWVSGGSTRPVCRWSVVLLPLRSGRMGEVRCVNMQWAANKTDERSR